MIQRVFYFVAPIGLLSSALSVRSTGFGAVIFGFAFVVGADVSYVYVRIAVCSAAGAYVVTGV